MNLAKIVVCELLFAVAHVSENSVLHKLSRDLREHLTTNIPLLFQGYSGLCGCATAGCMINLCDKTFEHQMHENPLGKSRGTLPQKILKSGVSDMLFPAF